MTPLQIETFLDRICGLFPSQQVSLAKAKEAWRTDPFLLAQCVEDGRQIIAVITEQCDKFPSLKQVHECFKLLNPQPDAGKDICRFCDGTGWVYPLDENGVRKTRTHGLFNKEGILLEYNYVVRCECFTTK